MHDLPKALPPHLRRRKQCQVPKGPQELSQYVDEQGHRASAMVLTQELVTVTAVWCGGEPVIEHDALDHDITFPAINVPTKDDPKRASLGDYVVQLNDGSFDVYKGWQFRSKFREV